MLKIILSLLLSLAPLSAIAAKNKDNWYNVESDLEKEKDEKSENYPYDSVDSPKGKPITTHSYFWNLRPKIGFSGGFHADKSVFNNNQNNRFFINTHMRFYNQPWNRWVANLQLLQNNTFFISASWELTPSRKANRSYYGLGLSHRLVSEQELNNFVDQENFYINLQWGREMLISKNRAWFFELRGLASMEDYVLQLSIGYELSL